MFIDSDLEVELNMIDLNCRSLAQMTHTFGGRFAKRGRGGIVLMSSLVAFQGVPRAANYAATKAYVQSLAEGIRAELKPLGVSVLASAPGPVKSGFGARAGMAITTGDARGGRGRHSERAWPARHGTPRPARQAARILTLPAPPIGPRLRDGAVMAGMTAHG